MVCVFPCDKSIHRQTRPSSLFWECEGSGDVVGVLTLLVGGVAQAFHDDRVVELRVQLEVQGRSRKGEASQRGCAMMMTMDECEKTQVLSQ